MQEMECEREVGNGRYIILISGVSKGLGRALALEFAKLGHIIVGCSRNQTKLDSLQAQLSTISSLPHFLLNVDVKSNDSVKEMAQTVSQKLGTPHVIVNNAAVSNENVKMWEGCVEEFHNVIDVNIKGTANVLRHFIPLMISKNNKGIVVNFSSLYGRVGAPMDFTDIYRFNDDNFYGVQSVVANYLEFNILQVAAYSSSKWAIEGLTKSLAKELPNGIIVVALDPGIINTDMLACHLGPHLASQYQTPQQWATKAASMILNLSSAGNGASLTVDDPSTPVSVIM